MHDRSLSRDRRSSKNSIRPRSTSAADGAPSWKLARSGLKVFDVTPLTTHGGSLRVYAQRPEGRRDIEMALFWGEGTCGLVVDAASGWRVNIGAGGDTADLGPDETAAHGALREARRWPRFVLP